MENILNESADNDDILYAVVDNDSDEGPDEEDDHESIRSDVSDVFSEFSEDDESIDDEENFYLSKDETQ